MNVKELTIELKNDLKLLKERYEKGEKPEDKRSKVFFQFVKEETTPVYKKIEVWEEAASAFVKRREAKVHPQQVASTRENMELLLLNSYYMDAKRQRYMDLHQSVLYVFDALLNDYEQSHKENHIN